MRQLPREVSGGKISIAPPREREVFLKKDAHGRPQLRRRVDAQQAEGQAAAGALVPKPKSAAGWTNSSVKQEAAVSVPPEARGSSVKQEAAVTRKPRQPDGPPPPAARKQAVDDWQTSVIAKAVAEGPARERGEKRAKSSDQEEAPEQKHRGGLRQKANAVAAGCDTPPTTAWLSAHCGEWIRIKKAWLCLDYPPENFEKVKAWNADLVVMVQDEADEKSIMVKQAVSAGNLNKCQRFAFGDVANRGRPGYADFARMIIKYVSNNKFVNGRKVVICIDSSMRLHAMLMLMMLRLAPVSFKCSTPSFSAREATEQMQTSQVALKAMKKFCPKLFSAMDLLDEHEHFDGINTVDKAEIILNAPEFLPMFLADSRRKKKG